MSRTVQAPPKARTERLVIKELGNETLIYDENNHEAHCLNETAAFVWRHCDGRTSARKIARLLAKDMNMPASEQLVWFALSQLEKSQLLERPFADEPQKVGQVSRRELMRRLGIAAAVAVPLVTSIVAPTTAEAASGCAGRGESCLTMMCCPGLSCEGICF